MSTQPVPAVSSIHRDIPYADPLGAPLMAITEAERKSDVLYYGGDIVLTVVYGAHTYYLLPQTPVRILPQLDYPKDKLTGRSMMNQPRTIPEGWDGATIAYQIAMRHSREGVVMLFDEEADFKRIEESKARSASFRVAQANQIKDWWSRQLDRVRPGSIPPPQPVHVRAALEFLHQQESGVAGRRRYVTRDGRDFDDYAEAVEHLEGMWPEMVHAAGGVEGLIVDLQAKRRPRAVAARQEAADADEGVEVTVPAPSPASAPPPRRRHRGRRK